MRNVLWSMDASAYLEAMENQTWEQAEQTRRERWASEREPVLWQLALEEEWRTCADCGREYEPGNGCPVCRISRKREKRAAARVSV